MNETSLPTVSGTGTQNSTQNPQAAGNSAGSGTSASSVQPGTVPNLLETQTSGMPLTSQNLPTISLTQPAGSVAQATAVQPADNPLASGASVIFFLLAIGILVAVFLPAKNTTK